MPFCDLPKGMPFEIGYNKCTLFQTVPKRRVTLSVKVLRSGSEYGDMLDVVDGALFIRVSQQLAQRASPPCGFSTAACVRTREYDRCAPATENSDSGEGETGNFASLAVKVAVKVARTHTKNVETNRRKTRNLDVAANKSLVNMARRSHNSFA